MTRLRTGRQNGEKDGLRATIWSNSKSPVECERCDGSLGQETRPACGVAHEVGGFV